MNILQVSAMDNYGGAARVALDLHTAYRKMGHRVRMVVGRKFGNDPDVDLLMNAPPSSKARRFLHKFGEQIKDYKFELGDKNLGRFFQRISKVEPVRSWNNYWGVEDFDYSGIWELLNKLSGEKPDVVHLHNLHANYFDLRVLPALSTFYPVVLTLHDAWLLSGHCAHSLSCERWKTGCGACPYLSISPPINHDATAFNWRRKRNIYARSQVYVVSPSQWLLNKACDENSILKLATVNSRVIPNGIDLTTFHPASKPQIRQELNISEDAFVLLFVATDSKNNMYKDYTTIQSALELVSICAEKKNILFLALGGENVDNHMGNTHIKFLPYVSDPGEIAKYYQAADVYLHAAHAETFPTVILEALSCGLPVVATNVGGIPEQVTDGVNGFLVGPLDAQLMSVRILDLLKNDELRAVMGKNASHSAKTFWGRECMVANYLFYYKEIILDWQSRHMG